MVGESHRQNTRILYGMLKAVDLLQIFTDLRYRPLDFDPPFFMIHIYLGPLFICSSIFAHSFDFAEIIVWAKISTMSFTPLSESSSAVALTPRSHSGIFACPLKAFEGIGNN